MEDMTDAQLVAEARGYDLLHAVEAKDAQSVKSLLKQGGDANDVFTMDGGNRSLLMIAAEQGDLPTVKVLLHAGADVMHKEGGERALSFASAHQYVGTGKEVSFHQLRPVHKYIEVVICLLQAEWRAEDRGKILQSKVHQKDALKGTR